MRKKEEERMVEEEEDDEREKASRRRELRDHENQVKAKLENEMKSPNPSLTFPQRERKESGRMQTFYAFCSRTCLQIVLRVACSGCHPDSKLHCLSSIANHVFVSPSLVFARGLACLFSIFLSSFLSLFLSFFLSDTFFLVS